MLLKATLNYSGQKSQKENFKPGLDYAVDNEWMDVDIFILYIFLFLNKFLKTKNSLICQQFHSLTAVRLNDLKLYGLPTTCVCELLVTHRPCPSTSLSLMPT